MEVIVVSLMKKKTNMKMSEYLLQNNGKQNTLEKKKGEVKNHVLFVELLLKQDKRWEVI